MALFAIKDIRANPFRHIERYPIRREKVEALRESLHTTGYWDNIVGRRHGKEVEIAYGHHRLEALKEVHENHNDRIEVITRDLSDERMLQIMARENMEAFGASAAVEQETVRAVVEAAANGTIELKPPKTKRKSSLRYAPSFLPGQKPAEGPEIPYTTRSIGNFLGWLQENGEPQRKVSTTLWALQLIEEDLLKEADFDNLSSTQAEAVVKQTRKVRDRERKAIEADRIAVETRLREADKRRKQAAKEQRRLEQEAARAKDEEQRRQAQLEASRAAREHRLAEEARAREAQRLKQEMERERQRKQEVRKKVTKVGRTISRKIKQGKLAIKDTGREADEIAPKPPGPPPRIEDLARRVANNVAGILDPKRDRDRVAALTSLVDFRTHLPKDTKKRLIEELRALAERAETYADTLGR